MKKVFALVVLSLITVSCYHNKNREVIKALEKYYTINTQLLKQRNQQYYDFLEWIPLGDCYRMDSNSNKLNKKIKEFYHFCDSFYYKNQDKKITINELYHYYSTAFPYFETLIPQRKYYKDTLKPKNFSLITHFKDYEKLSALMMRQHIVETEYKLVSYIASSIDACSSRFPIPYIYIQRLPQIQNNSHSFNLCSEYFIGINNKVTIDQLLRNGKPCSFPYTIRPIYGIETINLDSLQNGNYEIKGRIKILTFSNSIIVPFQHNFQITATP